MRAAAMLAGALAMMAAMLPAVPASAELPALDLVAVRDLAYVRSIALPGGPCILCTSGPGLTLGTYGAEGDAPEPLPAGAYFFAVAPSDPCPPVWHVELQPIGGPFAFPVLVWRDHTIIDGVPDVQDFTGHAGPIVMSMACGLSQDEVVLPEGNLGQAVEARLVLRDGAGADVDAYPAGP